MPRSAPTTSTTRSHHIPLSTGRTSVTRTPTTRTSVERSHIERPHVERSHVSINQRNNDLYRNFFTFIPLSTRTSSSLNNDLTQIQIENATEITAFADEMNETRCPISFEDFIPGENITRIKSCGHYFKTNGLMDWFRRSSQCPVCRFDLRDHIVDETTPIPNPSVGTDDDVIEILLQRFQPTQPSPEEEIPVIQNHSDYRNEISHFLESIIRNIDGELATRHDISNNEFVAEYSF